MTVPQQYEWLLDEGAPLMLIKALDLYGVKELPGTGNNQTILQWANEIGCSDYMADSIPWCGLFMGVVAHRAHKVVPWTDPDDCLWALNWKRFGIGHTDAKLGDTLVFKRPGGGHVGLYVGEDATAYHVLGGNTSDSVSIARIIRERCVAVRRPNYHSQPLNVRQVKLSSTGALSENEQ